MAGYQEILTDPSYAAISVYGVSGLASVREIASTFPAVVEDR